MIKEHANNHDENVRLVVQWLTGEKKINGADSSSHRVLILGIMALSKMATLETLHEVADKLCAKNSAFMACLFVRFNDLEPMYRKRIVNLLAKRSTQIYIPHKQRTNIVIRNSDLEDLSGDNLTHFVGLYASSRLIKWDLDKNEIDKICFNFLDHPKSAKVIKKQLTHSSCRNLEYTKDQLATAVAMHKIQMAKDGKINLFDVFYEGIQSTRCQGFEELEDYCYKYNLLGYGGIK